MIIRPKTKRRLLILLTCAVLFTLFTAWLYSYRIAIAERRVVADKQLGLEAYRNGDYVLALDKLSEYINHEQKRDSGQMDPQALLAFAESRAKVPTKNEDYIVTAVKTLRTYCELVPTDARAREQLVEMEAPFPTYTPDAISRANDILRDNPDDLVALKAIGEINFNLQKFKDAAPAVEHYVALAPTDLELQNIDFQIMKALSRPREQMHRHADELLAKYPADPRFKIVKAWAYLYGRDDLAAPEQSRQEFKAYRQLILDAAKADPPSVTFVKTTIGLLDNMAEFSVAGDLLNRASAKFSDPDLMIQTIARMWETRDYAQIVTRLKDLDAASPAISAHLIAYKALALYRLGRDKDADALVAQLDSRGSDDRVAYAWATGLKAQYAVPAQDLKTRLANYQDARSAAPNNGYVAFLLGEAYSQMGENDLALQAYRASCQLMPSWSQPQVRVAEILIGQGRGTSDEAARAAENARLAGTNSSGTTDLPAAIVNIRVSFARLAGAPDSSSESELLQEVKLIQSQLPGEPHTLPILVALLAQTGQREAAIDAISQACKNPGDGGEDSLMDLVQSSRAAKLGMEAKLYAAIESKYGMTPRLAYARAMELLNSGQAADGLSLLTSARKTSGGATNPVDWDHAICQYLETSHDAGAPAAWEKLGNTYPGDVAMQSMILTGGNSAWANRAFIQQTIDRLHALTGDGATGWKTAYARFLLAGTGGDNDATEVVTLMTAVTTDSPDEYLPHVLLATAYDRLKNTSAALDEWRRSAEMAQQSPQAQYAYLQALHRAGKKEDSQVVFDKLAATSNIPPEMALAAATIMASEGDMPRAENMLVAYPNTSNQILHDATLAKVYRIENRPNDAAAIYFNLQNSKNLDVNVIREAADFFGAQNQIPEARKFLDRLVELRLPAGRQQLIEAAFEEEHGSAQAAAKLYDDAVKLAADDPQPALRTIGFLIRQRDWKGVGAAVDAANSRWPGNPSIANLARAAGELSNYPRPGDIGPLIELVTADPQNAAAMETLSAATDPASTLAQARDLTDKYPDFEPAYELLSRRLMAAGNTGEAVAVAGKAMGKFPRSVDAARTMAEVDAAAGNWNDAMIAGREWRRRVTENPRGADQFIAVADLAVDQPLDAVDRLAPYIADAKAHADDNQTMLSTYAQALIRVGREPDAEALLLPLAKNSAKCRLAALDLAPICFGNASDANNWISKIQPLLTPDSIQEQEDLAEVYVALAERQNYPSGYAAAMNTLQPFLQTPGMGAHEWLTYAGAAGGKGDLTIAEQAYRQVLKLDSTSAVAQNNLADVLRQTGSPQSLAEAEQLASQAITSHPNDPERFNYYDTLARVLLKEGRATDAIAAFQKGYALNPKSPDILIGLASTCAANNQTDQAVRYLAQIDAIIPPGAPLSAELQAELANARQAVRKTDAHSSVTGTNFSPSGK